MLEQVEADECEYRNAYFKGYCQEEVFVRGSCKGFLLRHCICAKPCGSPGDRPTYEPLPPPPEEEEERKRIRGMAWKDDSIINANHYFPILFL